MAVLIPALGRCLSRMTSGEKRLAERLEQKLDDYLRWYDLAVGPKTNPNPLDQARYFEPHFVEHRCTN